MIYSYAEVCNQFSDLLEQAITNGQAKFKHRNGQIFIICPEQSLQISPLEVPSLNCAINMIDIIEAIRESRERKY